MLGGYSVLKDAVKDPRTGEISTSKSLVCSAVAGGAAHAVTYPLHLARTVLQQPVAEGGRAFSGFVDVLRHRIATQGIAGCFRGLPIWLVRTLHEPRASRLSLAALVCHAYLPPCLRPTQRWLAVRVASGQCNRVPAVAIEFAVNERALDAMKTLGVMGRAKSKLSV